MSQIDLFGGETPLEELELPAILAMLAEAERDLDSELTPDEAGALIHARRSKHGPDQRCHYCAGDGREALERLRSRIPLDPGGRRQESGPEPSRLTDTSPPGSSGPDLQEGRSGNDAVAPPAEESRSMAPRARSTDPDTSHKAAASVRAVTPTQEAILEILKRGGPMTDEQIGNVFVAQVAHGYVSPSGLRTRRAELVAAGEVVDTGMRAKLASGRDAIVWGLSIAASTAYDREPEL